MAEAESAEYYELIQHYSDDSGSVTTIGLGSELFVANEIVASIFSPNYQRVSR